MKAYLLITFILLGTSIVSRTLRLVTGDFAIKPALCAVELLIEVALLAWTVALIQTR